MAKAPADIRSLARAHTVECIQTLAGIQRNGTSEDARIRAAGFLIERGWGRAPQPVTGADGEGAIEILVRHIVDGKK